MSALAQLYENELTAGQQVNRLYAERNGFHPQVVENAVKLFEEYKLNEKDLLVFYLPNRCIAFEWTCIHGDVNLEIGLTRYSMYITHPGMDNKTILSRSGFFTEVVA